MKFVQKITVAGTLIALVQSPSPALAQSPSSEPETGAKTPPRYSWMLPKTVIDATVVYAFHGCSHKDKSELVNFHITPKVAPRSVADTYAGEITTEALGAGDWLQDGSISIDTYSNTHVLKALGSNPVVQTGTVVGNILGDIAKLFGIIIGVKIEENIPPGTTECKNIKVKQDIANAAQYIFDAKNKLKDMQKRLADGPDDGDLKKLPAQIQAIQTYISMLQSDLTVTMKATIDPGFSPIKITKGSDTQNVFHHKNDEADQPKPIDKDGLVATFYPDNQLDKWFENPEASKDELKRLLQVNVYLDFQNSYPLVQPNAKSSEGVEKEDTYVPKAIQKAYLYRDVAYIPVLVWHGQKPKDLPSEAAIQAPLIMAFGQFGFQQKLPLRAK